MKDGLKVRGMFRVQIDEDGKIVGDTGWKKNVITNLGFNHYLVAALGAITNPASKQVSHVALGTGGAPATDATTLAGELASRASVTAATSSTSKALQLTATFSSSDSFVAGASNISNIGLFNSSAAGTLFAGNTYTSSALATNQNVNVTYVVSFS